MPNLFETRQSEASGGQRQEQATGDRLCVLLNELFHFYGPSGTYISRSLDGGVVTIARKNLVLGGELGGDVLDGLLSDLGEGLSALVVSSRASAALVLELVDDAGVLPADFGGETTQDGVRSVGTESEGAEGVGDDEALDLIKRRGDTLENL